MSEYLIRKVRRAGFYLRGMIRDNVPALLYEGRLEKIHTALNARSVDDSILSRVNYYNKLSDSFALDHYAPTCSAISRSEGSYYYYDLKEHLRYFPSDLKVAYLFGDNVLRPESPTIVKSRPIHKSNHNAILLNLDKLRHFSLFTRRDKTAFRDKRNRAVWRGALNNPIRLALINSYGTDKRHDIGYVGEPRLDCTFEPSPWLNVRKQLQNRYVISVEGYDVATNLKWIFASQSLCLMPKPKYETWFMEGTLVPGTHFVELRPDFEDLEEKIAFFESHPDEAESIISAANGHYRQFMDKKREEVISVLVLQKYFELSRQLPRQAYPGNPFQLRE